LIDSVFEKL